MIVEAVYDIEKFARPWIDPVTRWVSRIIVAPVQK